MIHIKLKKDLENQKKMNKTNSSSGTPSPLSLTVKSKKSVPPEPRSQGKLTSKKVGSSEKRIML